MRKTMWFIIAIACLFVFCMSNINTALAAGPELLNIKATKVVLKTDKTGNPYARIIFKRPTTVSGHKVELDTILMCFNDTYPKAKRLRPGASFKVIAVPSEYKGRINYQAVKFID